MAASNAPEPDGGARVRRRLQEMAEQRRAGAPRSSGRPESDTAPARASGGMGARAWGERAAGGRGRGCACERQRRPLGFRVRGSGGRRRLPRPSRVAASVGEGEPRRVPAGGAAGGSGGRRGSGAGGSGGGEGGKKGKTEESPAFEPRVRAGRRLQRDNARRLQRGSLKHPPCVEVR